MGSGIPVNPGQVASHYIGISSKVGIIVGDGRDRNVLALAGREITQIPVDSGAALVADAWRSLAKVQDTVEVIQYTIKINNTGNENAKNVKITDLIPSNTIYVPNSTTLNGTAVADISGQSPLISGLTVNTPGDLPGWVNIGKTVVVVFQVTVDQDVTPGSIISNQASVMASGEASGPITPVLSDDPDTEIPGDPTCSVVGNGPFIYPLMTVADDNGGILNPGETITYTVTIYNNGTANATNVVFKDSIPSGVTYEPGYFTVDGSGVTDPVLTGGSLAVPLGTIVPGAKRTLTYKARVNSGTTGIISNQGQVALTELPDQLTDSDGNIANGAQPTEIMVGSGPALRLTKLGADINGGNLEAGDTVEFTLIMQNVGNVNATNVTIIDPIPGTLVYVSNSATSSGLPLADKSGSSPFLSAGSDIGTVAAGDSVVIKYRVTVGNNVPPGTIIDTQANFTADDNLIGISNLVRLQTGGSPGTASVSGAAWFDTNLNDLNDNNETKAEGWQVQIFQQTTLVGTTTVDSNGNYWFIGLAPGNNYRLQFSQPGGSPVWKVIDNISLVSGTVLADQNLPIHPTGIIYDAVTRQPVAGAKVTISGPAGFDPFKHLLAGEEGQITDARGEYYFNLLFTVGAPDGIYTISVTPPNTYSPVFPSTIIPAQPGVLTPADPDPSNSNIPQGSQSTNYYLQFNLSAGGKELTNNHIPLDPILKGSVLLTKTAAKKAASMGDFVPYTVKLENQITALIQPFTLQDQLPPGFKYAKGSARINGVAVEPTGETSLSWTKLSLPPNGKMVVTYDLIIGSHVMEGNTYKNSATAYHGITGTAISNTGSAQVQITGEPLFTASLIIGKVFNDKNGNGVQDEGEEGVPGVRIITTSGQIITTDSYGRYHIDSIQVSNFDRGQNFVIKVDPRSIPVGMVFTTENPRVVHLTQGMMAKVNFGVRIPPDGHPQIQNPVIPTPTPLMPVITRPVIVITVTKVIPDTGMVNTKISAIIEGTGFRPGANIVFSQNKAILTVTNIKVVTETQISCELDLSGAAIGKYDVTVTNDDGNSGGLPQAFTVKQQDSPPNPPLKGFNNGSLLITLAGPDIKPGVTVKLIGAGGIIIPGIIVETKKDKIEVFFNIKDQPVGLYDCYAYYQDSHSTKLETRLEIRKFSPEQYNAQTLIPVYFDFDKSNIRPNQVDKIEHDLEVLLKNPNTGIMLGGYTDERGSYVYNLGLSMRRANAVKQYLVEHGVKPEQISIYSYGKEFAKKGTNDNIWQNDRRVDVVMYEDKD